MISKQPRKPGAPLRFASGSYLLWITKAESRPEYASHSKPSGKGLASNGTETGPRVGATRAHTGKPVRYHSSIANIFQILVLGMAEGSRNRLQRRIDRRIVAAIVADVDGGVKLSQKFLRPQTVARDFFIPPFATGLSRKKSARHNRESPAKPLPLRKAPQNRIVTE